MTVKVKRLLILSPVFKHNAQIPAKFTCDGAKISPPLQIGEMPEDTKVLALIMEDPDAPGGTYDHWLVWNIQPVSFIEEGSNPGISGTNSSGKTGYHPPCPPSGSHRYIFNIFALSAMLDLPPGAEKKDLVKAMHPLIIAHGSITGLYQREK